MVYVEVIQGPDKGKTFEVSEGELVIGRQSEEFSLSDGTVSRQHARLSTRGGNWYIEDIGSVNGTFVNGVKVNRSTRLHLGDQVRCGGSLLVFGGAAGRETPALEMDESGRLVDAAIMATVPSNEDSVISPTPEAGAEAIDNLRLLYNLTSELSSIFNLDMLIRRGLEIITEVVPADRAYILLYQDGQLVTKAFKDSSEKRSDKIPISRTIINEVLAKQVGVLSSNAMRDKRFSSGKSVHAYGIRSALAVPIKGHDKVMGVIHVDCSVSEHTYSTEQLRLLTAIGYQMGLAIQNVRLYEEAVKSERMTAIGATVAYLSHHVKNILQAMSTGTQVMETALKSGQMNKAREVWPIMRRSLARLNAVVLNMLAYSKPREPLLENVNVNHVLQEVVDMVSDLTDERGVAVITDLADMPPIPADATGLQQVFLNLLNNALEAVPPQHGAITIASDFSSLTQLVTVTVSDNGVGIPADQLPLIWEVFHSSKGNKGTGLGLAVTRKIVREHGGQITVDSTPGKGTSFTVTLPARPGATASPSDTNLP
jgi:K+-sensing histidine kinase KdpD